MSLITIQSFSFFGFCCCWFGLVWVFCSFNKEPNTKVSALSTMLSSQEGICLPYGKGSWWILLPGGRKKVTLELKYYGKKGVGLGGWRCRTDRKPSSSKILFWIKQCGERTKCLFTKLTTQESFWEQIRLSQIR